MTGEQDPGTLVPLQERYAEELALVNGGVVAFVGEFQEIISPQESNPDVLAAGNSYLSVLLAGGKRLRGLLAVAGYRMYGGEDDAVIGPAAGAIEAIHAGLLVQDDVLDDSDRRRGVLAAHRQIEDHLASQGRLGDLPKMAEGFANLAADTARSAAHRLVQRLPTDHPNICLASDVLDTHLAQTGVGQMLDLSAAGRKDVSVDEIMRIDTAKTAYYSFLMPLQVGAALAGANESELGHFNEYSEHAGLAFQLQDDIIGLYGDEATTGKPPMSDMMEGKRTLLVTLALARTLEMGDVHGYEALDRALGNKELQKADFDYCLEVISRTGALDEAKTKMADHTTEALRALDRLPDHWKSGKSFQILQDLALYNLQRAV